MTLKELEKGRADAKTSSKYYEDRIKDHIDTSTFTGKELLDLIESRKDDALWETNPYKIFADMMMEIIRKRE